MINLTNSLQFLSTGKELRAGIFEAIITTRKILFDIYSEGKHVDPENITSGSKRIPKTWPLAFCKYFLEEDIFDSEITISEEEFLNYCHDLTGDSKQNKDFEQSHLKKIIPRFNHTTGNLPGVFITELKRSFSVMLFSLWRNNHVILTLNYSMPTYKLGANTSPQSLCDPLYSEVIEYFQSFRQKTVPGTAILQASQGLTPSIQNTIQSYAYKLVVATDWHSIEEVNLNDCIEVLDHLSEERSAGRSTISYPVNHMVHMMNQHFAERLSFTSEDIANGRSKCAAPLGDDPFIITYAPRSIKTNAVCEPHTGKNIVEHNSSWLRSQEFYLEKCMKAGRKSMKGVERPLALLNQYLFSIIPLHKKDAGLEDLSPPSPAEFDRRFLEETDDFPTLIEFVCKGRKSATAYGYLREMDSYFDYFEAMEKINKRTDGFLNPIIREVDFPINQRSGGTTKKIISQMHLPALLSYLYAMESLFSYIYERLKNFDKNVTDVFHNYSNNANTVIKTEDLGYCPIMYFRKKCIPITEVVLDIFQSSECTINHIVFFRSPAWSHLLQLIVCLETGIRTMHVEWLDIRLYDKEIDRSAPLPDLVKLYVSTDKVRQTPWLATVSKRVIMLLDLQRKILSDLNYSWCGREIWYDKHEGSVFGKIVPAFPSSATTSSGLPNRDGYISLFKRMLFSFQEYANKNELFSKKIDWAVKIGNVYKSIITPHSCRATVISHAIHFLPPEVIGDIITGHMSPESVSFYSCPDPLVMDELETFQARRAKGLASLAIIAGSSSIYADDINAAIHRAIDKDIHGALIDFGATSFERERNGGEVSSGISAIKAAERSELAYHRTHICTCNNCCPDDVVLEVGANNCGGCWLSVKTVDNIPAIDAHIRKLYAEISDELTHIDDMLLAGASKSTIEVAESLNMKKAAELTAWIVTLNILEELRKDISTRDKFVVGKPEIILKNFTKMTAKANPMTNLLLRVQDAVNYPEYLTPSLRASMKEVRNRILARTGNYDLILKQPNGYAQLDEFRGIVRSILETSNVSLDDLYSLMSSELPVSSNLIPLLEVS